MLNITSENSTNAMKRLNNINKDIRIINEVRNEAARNIIKDSSTDD